MQELQFKSFLLGMGGDYDGGMDALAANPDELRFVVADGVTKSNHPKFLSRRLCEAFVEANINWTEVKELKGKFLFPHVPDIWERDVLLFRSSLEGRRLEQDTLKYEDYDKGASTFCGIFIDKIKGILNYIVVGDSTLFVNFCDGKIGAYNTSPKEVDGNGVLRTLYSNRTSAVLSDNSILGTCETGEIVLASVASVALMTDGMAQWFQNKIIQGDSPFEDLWGIADMKQFEEFIESESKDGDLDDDLAVILIKFIKKGSPETNLEYEKICRIVFGIEP